MPLPFTGKIEEREAGRERQRNREREGPRERDRDRERREGGERAPTETQPGAGELLGPSSPSSP